ncbi:MAG: hypothetical protein ACRCSC_04660 [Lactococcus garvieae]
MINGSGGDGSRRASLESSNDPTETPEDNRPQPLNAQPSQAQREGWLDWGLNLVIRTVRNVVTNPWTLLGLGLAVPALYAASNTSNVGGSGPSGSGVGQASNLGGSPPPPALNLSQVANNSSQSNGTEHLQPIEQLIPTNLNAILAAAGYLNQTQSAQNGTEPEPTVEISMSFADAECEDYILADIFDDGNNTTNATEVIDNATIWQSSHIFQRQMRVNLEQLQVALGATVLDAEGCVTNLSVDPASFPDGTNATAILAEREAVAALSSPPEMTCLRLFNDGLTGNNIEGQPVFHADLHLCHPGSELEVGTANATTANTTTTGNAAANETSTQAHHNRERRNAAPPPTTSQSAQNSTLEQGAVGGSTTNTTESTTNLARLVQEIRAEFCPENVTIMGNIANTTNGSDYSLLIQDIQRLCPNATVFDVVVDAVNDIFSAFGWARALDSYLSNVTARGASLTVITLDSAVRSESTDMSPVNSLIELLHNVGVTIFSASPDSLLEDSPRVRVPRATAEALVSGSDFIRTAESPVDNSRGRHIAAAVVIGGLLFLIPAMVYRAYLRRQREARATYEPAPTDDPNDNEPPSGAGAGSGIPLVNMAEGEPLLSTNASFEPEDIVLQFIDTVPNLFGDRSGQEWPSKPSDSSRRSMPEQDMRLADLSTRTARLQQRQQEDDEDDDEFLFPQNPNTVSTARQASMGGLSWVPIASQESLNNVSPLVFQPARQASASTGNLYQGAYSADDPLFSRPIPIIPSLNAENMREVASSEPSLTDPLLGDESEDVPLQEQAQPRFPSITSPFEKGKKFRSQTDVAVEHARRMDNYRADPHNETRLKALAEEMKKLKDDEDEKDKEKKSD